MDHKSFGDFLRIRGLSVTYFLPDGREIKAVDDLDLTIGAGETVGILGESGCGKTSLAHAILRLLPAQARCDVRELSFCGRDLAALSESSLRAVRGHEISLITQDPALALNPVICVGSQITEVLRAHLATPTRERRTHAIDLLGEMGFENPEEIYAAYPHQLSGGQRQRIVIAQAIACNPALLIADEPTSHLDAPVQAEIITLLTRIQRQRGMAVLIISHDPALLAGFTHRLTVMYSGRIVEVGETSQVFRQPLHPYTDALVKIADYCFASPPSRPRDYFAAIEGEQPEPTAPPTGCRFHPRCPDRKDLCSQRYPQGFVPFPAHEVKCFKYGE